ncbi:tail fiber domain-containing protein [Spirosoma validum]|uniref:Tail fiber domain-containing protein n=1 Tax=Spirosoma validum TaxID=2771355 RepID=A0A927GG77_9BACT|nr:tail fiber domain-containing protein [Spirosoma validum]MBD2756594.1 tail fiber domain-containing protein [Spirosoma validum]
MKQIFFCALFLLSSSILHAQVGIGTTTPKAFFNVADGKDVLFGQDVSGAGKKLIWYADKAAFRAGYVNGTQWNIAQVGPYSFAAGYNATASGNGGIAMGSGTSASGLSSTALGINVSTNNRYGSFIIGDLNSEIYSNTNDNQMMMRFSNGYKFFTNLGSQTYATGLEVLPGGNAWQTTSDSTRKENFRPANGADFLKKIANMRLGSWNYKGQDAKTYRHYGPMAQDFFAAFGHDELGTIGEDKSINQADFDGVNLIAIQALIRKIEKLEAENGSLREETASLRSDIEIIKRHLANDSKLTFKP